LLKSRAKLHQRLEKHLKDIEEYKKTGGHTSSVEREIRNFRSLIQAIDDLLK
jgi:hypothetical protein